MKANGFARCTRAPFNYSTPVAATAHEGELKSSFNSWKICDVLLISFPARFDPIRQPVSANRLSA